jgi:serine/threonine protein kinase/type 1 glutamine amidotransferase
MNAQTALHPTDQSLQAYGLGKLDDATAESVNQHLESCPDCRSRVAAMSSDSFLGKLRDAQGRPHPTAPVVSSLTGLSMTDAGASVVAPPPASTLPPGLADHPDYRILRELGRGGMGVVYLAENTLMGRKEVLKVVGSQLISRPGILDRFLREIRSAAKLHHPNIVAAYSALRLGESLVLAMEYVDGLDLARVVKAKGPLPVVHACSFIHQAALGLQHAHERGMVHRDIKPANLILSRDGKKHIVKVLDFGLAKVSSEGQTDSALTREGQMLGTPDYIAPEQIRDAQSADIRADIYSLGCTFYYLLTGGPPFGGDHLWDIYQAHFSMDATPLNLERPEVPVEVAALVAKMMAKEPAKRFQTPGEVAQALLPFFKPGAVGSVGSKPEISQIERPEARPVRAVGASAPPQSIAETAPELAPAVRKSTAPTQPGSIFEGLIDLGEKGTRFDSILDRTPPATGPATKQQGPEAWSTVLAKIKRLGPQTWWAVAGALLFGLIVAWAAVILKVKTANGWIVLENVPENAVVEIDGDRVTVTPNGGESIQIEAAAGKHDVVVKRGDDSPFVKRVPVESGKPFKLTVRLESPAAPEPKTTLLLAVDTPPMSGTDVIKRQEPIDRTQFTKISGQWDADGDELVQSDATRWNATLLFGDKRWTDYDFTVDAMPTGATEHSSFSLFFRSTGSGESLEYLVDGEGNNSCHVILHEKEASHRLPNGFTFHLRDHKWYTARVHVRGKHFACSLYDNESGSEIDRFDVEYDHQPNGCVGLGTCYYSPFRFKNIKVTSPDGRVLWEGLPAVGSRKPTVLSSPSSATQGDSVPATEKRSRPKRLLAITESAAFSHKVSERTDAQPSLVQRSLQELGESGDFEVVDSQDSRGWIKPEYLKDFDAVFFYTSGELSITPEGKAALLAFVRSGKGFAGSHCAADTLYQWPEYGELIGAYFNKHLGDRDVTIRVDDPAHPSTRHLGKSFKVREEIYQFKAPFSRDKVHILMHFDYPGVSNGGAMAWTKEYGKGRVFYTALGHDEVIWKDERFRKHLLGGLRYVLGLETSVPPASERTDGFVSLFNGKDLTGWVVDSGLRSCWRTGNGELILTGPGDYRKSGFLLTDREYADFLLKFEFQPSPNTNSGVAFWAWPGEFFEGLPHHPQIELFDADKDRIKNGSFIWSKSIGDEKILDPFRPVELKPAGVWNTMEVEVRGGILRLVINGSEGFRSDLAKLGELPGAHPGLLRRSGRIGLQSHTGTVRFRNIMVKDLSVPR